MPDIAESRTPDGLPCIEWRDKEFRPHHGVALIAAIVGVVAGVTYGETSGQSGIAFGIVGFVIALAIGALAERELFRFKARQRRCFLSRSARRLIFEAQPDIATGHRNSFPYEDLESFVVGAASEWFDPRQYRVTHMPEVIDPLVIFAQQRNGEHIIVASHVGSQQDMADLHVLLTQRFIVERTRWR
jgi:hypothetical protein